MSNLERMSNQVHVLMTAHFGGREAALCTAVAFVALAACSDATGPRFDSRTPYAISIAAPADSVPAWSDVKMIVTAVDSNGKPIDRPRLQWRSRDTLTATVDSEGVLHTRGGGYTTVFASSWHDSASVVVEVETPRVATLKLPDTVHAPLLSILSVPVEALDAEGRPVHTFVALSDSGRLLDTYIVSVPITVHTGVSRLYATPASGGVTGTTTLVVGAPLTMSAFPDTVAMLVGDSARQLHTRAPWPWWGQGCSCGGPGDATSGVERWSSSDPAIARVDSSGRLTALAAGHATINAESPSTGAHAKIEAYVYRYSPALSYAEVAPMQSGVCARTVDGRALCTTTTFDTYIPFLDLLGPFGTLSPADRCEYWLSSLHGPPYSYPGRCTAVPLVVDGDHRFTALAAQPGYAVLSACGIDDAGATWCWGTQPVRQDAVPPLTDITPFNSLSSYCGLGTNGGALCFDVGKAPTTVSGSHVFAALAGNSGVACGIDDASVTWCWGDNSSGTLGDSTTVSSTDPVRVHTSASFVKISIGATTPVACAVDTSAAAWCWGGVGAGVVPKRAPTSESFTSIAVADHMACGVASSGSITCWDPLTGTSTFAGPSGSNWTSVFGADRYMCAVSSTGRAGCWTQKDGGVAGYREIPRGG